MGKCICPLFIISFLIWFISILFSRNFEFCQISFIDSIFHHFLSRSFSLNFPVIFEWTVKNCVCENYENLRRKYLIVNYTKRNYEDWSSLLQVFRSSGTCVWGRPKTNTKAILHQQCFDRIYSSWNTTEKLEIFWLIFIEW